MATSNVQSGKITQVIGPVVDVEFPPGALPDIYTALAVTNPGIDARQDNLVIEVAQHLGENTARCVAMDSTDGLVRGMPVKSTGAPISVPVGKAVLGRILNVVGEPVDELGPLNATQFVAIHKPPPPFVEQSTEIEAFETGIKVVDLLAPYLRGGKIGLFGGAGVGKTVLLLELIRTEKVTFSHCVPTILRMLLRNPGAERYDLTGITMLIGGAAMPRALCLEAMRRGLVRL